MIKPALGGWKIMHAKFGQKWTSLSMHYDVKSVHVRQMFIRSHCICVNPQESTHFDRCSFGERIEKNIFFG